MHLQYNYCDDGNYSKSPFILSRDMKIFKRLMCFKFTILLISRLLEGVRGWKKPQINLLKQEKRNLVFVLHLILCFNSFVHIFKDNFQNKIVYSDKITFLNTRNIFSTSLLTLLIFVLCYIIILCKNAIDYLNLLAIMLNKKSVFFYFCIFA